MASRPVLAVVGAGLFSIVTVFLVHHNQSADRKVNYRWVSNNAIYIILMATIEAEGRRTAGYRETGEKGRKQETIRGADSFAAKAGSTN